MEHGDTVGSDFFEQERSLREQVERSEYGLDDLERDLHAIDAELGELGTESGGQQQQRSDHRPRAPSREPAPPDQTTIDGGTDLHRACDYMSDHSY